MREHLTSAQLATPIGPMLAVADTTHLHALEFAKPQRLERSLAPFHHHTPGTTAPIVSIERELALYFQGKLQQFKTPIRLHGTPFQQQAWQALLSIPIGTTWSYQQQAHYIGRPTAHRAVANANSRNRLAIIIPCHRVIRHNGNLGGYGGGLENKQWLLHHEQTIDLLTL